MSEPGSQVDGLDRDEYEDHFEDSDNHGASVDLLLLGNIGVGKSTLGNFLLSGGQLNATETFETGDRFESCTAEMKFERGMFTVHRQKDKRNLHIGLVDSPGFGVGDKDEDNLVRIRTFMQRRKLHGVAIVLDGNSVRMDGKIQRILAIAANAALDDDGNLSRLAIIVSKFNLSPDFEMVRMRQFKKTCEEYLKSFEQRELSSAASGGTQSENEVNSETLWKYNMCKVLDKLLPATSIVDFVESQVFFLDTFFDAISKGSWLRNSTIPYAQRSMEQFWKFQTWMRGLKTAKTFVIGTDIVLSEVVSMQMEKVRQLEKSLKDRVASELAEHKKLLERTPDTDYFCAFLSQAIYHGEAKFREACKDLKLTCVEFDAGNTTYAIVQDRNTLFLIFKGTSKENISDWISNVNVKATFYESKGGNVTLHAGYFALLKQPLLVTVSESTGQSMDVVTAEGHVHTVPQKEYMTLSNKIYKQLCGKTATMESCVRLVYSGHSLGGALAVTCRAFHLCDHGQDGMVRFGLVETVTFGAPLVISRPTTILGGLSSNSRHYVYGSDIVPRILHWRSGEHSMSAQRLQNFLVDVGMQVFEVEVGDSVWTRLKGAIAASHLLGAIGGAVGGAIGGAEAGVFGRVVIAASYGGAAAGAAAGGVALVGSALVWAFLSYSRRRAENGIKDIFTLDLCERFLEKARAFEVGGELRFLNTDSQSMFAIPPGKFEKMLQDHQPLKYVEYLSDFRSVSAKGTPECGP